MSPASVKGADGLWRDVPCDFGTLAINIGDMLQEASQGLLPQHPASGAEPHRRQRPPQPCQLPLFLHPRNDVVLSEALHGRQLFG